MFAMAMKKAVKRARPDAESHKEDAMIYLFLAMCIHGEEMKVGKKEERKIRYNDVLPQLYIRRISLVSICLNVVSNGLNAERVIDKRAVSCGSKCIKQSLFFPTPP
jgi:hypothetical protein